MTHTDTFHHALFARSTYHDAHLSLTHLFEDPPSLWRPTKTLTTHTCFQSPNADWLVFRSVPTDGEAPPIIPSLTALSLPFSVSIRNQSGGGGRRGPEADGLLYVLRIAKSSLDSIGLTLPPRRYPFVARWFDTGTLELWLPLIPILELLEHGPQENQESLPSPVDNPVDPHAGGPLADPLPLEDGSPQGNA